MSAWRIVNGAEKSDKRPGERNRPIGRLPHRGKDEIGLTLAELPAVIADYDSRGISDISMDYCPVYQNMSAFLTQTTQGQQLTQTHAAGVSAGTTCKINGSTKSRDRFP